MALSQPRVIYGVHSFAPYSRSTGLPYGIAKVLASSSLTLKGDQDKLKGGYQKYPWAVEEGLVSAELSLKVKEYPDFLFELFLGKAPTANAAEASASVTAITDKFGGSVVAATGIATVTVDAGSEADVKFGKFVVKAVSATTVDVYLLSDVDITRGTDGAYQNDALKITASPLTIVASTAVAIPNFGLELTGGAGIIAMTIGHTATFESRPINTASMDVIIGGSTDTFPEFGAVVLAQKRGSEEMFEVNLYRCKGAGLPIGFNEKAFSEGEIKAEAFYDATLNGVMAIRAVSPS